MRSWNDRVGIVETLAETPGFQHLRRELIALAKLGAGDRVLDVGAGSGLIALAAAPEVAHVTAVDISAPMCAALRRRIESSDITNVDVQVADAVELPLADETVDVVLSNYCLHHLPHSHKSQALSEIARVLRPGGRFVLGDMMFEIGLRTPRDRAVLGRFVRTQLRRGPAGIARLARNTGRLLSGRSEHPASVEWWAQGLRTAGFVDVRSWCLPHEGGIAVARRPHAA
jgi:ubiquinone/menaquinone biosynthesis C-methylase UbiE